MFFCFLFLGMKKIKQVTKIVGVTLHGKGYIDNMTIAASAHKENLLQAANWLVILEDCIVWLAHTVK